MLDLARFRAAFGKVIHPFTGVDYVDYYKGIIEKAGAEAEIVFSNRVQTVLDYTDTVICCDIHTRARSKRLLKAAGAKVVLGLDDLLTAPVDGSGYNPQYGLLGSNKADDSRVKLFPRDAQAVAEAIGRRMCEATGHQIEAMVYGDGAFKDPAGKIWELADPVVSPGYTKGLEGTPNELKRQYVGGNEFGDAPPPDRPDRLALRPDERLRRQGHAHRLYPGLLRQLHERLKSRAIFIRAVGKNKPRGADFSLDSCPKSYYTGDRPISDILRTREEPMNIQLSEHFTYGKLLRFTLPSIVMMAFSSIYGVVDGVFVSNFVGADPFAAINLIMPFLMILGAVGFMLGTGGSALVAYMLGAGNERKANETFSLLIYVLITLGAIFTVLGLLFLESVARLLGADETLLPYCVSYGRVILIALIPFMLQNAFQSFLVTAERPHFGLYITIAAGVTNIVLDALFIAVLRLGVVGAALATTISQYIGGVIPLLYFIFPNKSKLRLCRARLDLRAIAKAGSNGASEFMTNISMSIVNILYNWQLMRLMGSDGVAVFGVIMYVNFIFVSIFLGYSMGSAPIVGYHYGAGNRTELQGLLRKSLRLIGVLSAVLTAAAELLARPLAMIFVSYDVNLLAVTQSAFAIYAISFLLVGFNIYASSFFTALNDGFTSALISFARTLVFQIAAVVLLPLVLGVDGVWGAVIFAELLALFLSWYCFARNRKKYGYA